MLKQIFSDLAKEFGITEKTGKEFGRDSHWIEIARVSDKVAIFDEGGKNVEAGMDAGQLNKQGDVSITAQGVKIFEVQSVKHGVVKIEVGGDGTMNGDNDKIISTGGQVLADATAGGVNEAIGVSAAQGENVEIEAADIQAGDAVAQPQQPATAAKADEKIQQGVDSSLAGYVSQGESLLKELANVGTLKH